MTGKGILDQIPFCLITGLCLFLMMMINNKAESHSIILMSSSMLSHIHHESCETSGKICYVLYGAGSGIVLVLKSNFIHSLLYTVKLY